MGVKRAQTPSLAREASVILSEAEGSLTVPPSHQIPSPGGEG